MRKTRTFCKFGWSEVQATKNISDMLRRPEVLPFTEMQFLPGSLLLHRHTVAQAGADCAYTALH